MNPRLSDWRGKRVWIVGASSGIGRATAQALHERGALVVVSARNAQALEYFCSSHPGATGMAVDVCEHAQVARAAHAILRDGPLDLVMYCAGHYRAQRATAFDLAEMRRHVEVNYLGALNLLDAVLPALITRGGHLSLVASVAGYRALPEALAYGPTKAALIQLAETLHLDLRRHGVGVSLVNPGFVETPMTAQNRFRMPALQTPAQAAAAILRGWERGRFEIHFPRRFTLLLKALRLLPFAAYAPLVRSWTST